MVGKEHTISNLNLEDCHCCSFFGVRILIDHFDPLTVKRLVIITLPGSSIRGRLHKKSGCSRNPRKFSITHMSWKRKR